MKGANFEAEEIRHWLIDGFNVLHACVLSGGRRDGWWKADSQALVVHWLRPFVRPEQLHVYFDARSPNAERYQHSERAPELRFVVNADDAIVDLVSRAEEPASVCVVSADRALLNRVYHAGACRLRPWVFQERYLDNS